MSKKHIPGLLLRGTLVGLRPLERGDAEACYRFMNDPDIRAFMQDAYSPKSFEEEITFVTQPNTDVHIRLAVVELATGRFVGTAAIMDINHVHRYCTTGLTIGDRKKHGKGFGTETKELLLRYAFQKLNLERVETNVFSGNIASLRMQEKVGMTLDGIRRRRLLRDGVWYDAHLFSMLREDWVKRHTA